MKFVYVDESGDSSQSDVFVMAGLLIDSHRLRKKTADFDLLLNALFEKHPGSPKELKTKSFINGRGGWNRIPPDERKQFLRSVCELATEKGDKIYGLAMSLSKFREKKSELPFNTTYWIMSEMFIASSIQKRMQTISRKKGITAMVVDDNKAEMPNLSEYLYKPHQWFDGLYQVKTAKRGKTVWTPRKEENRFEHIINTGFAVKSEHSSLVQVADAFCWVYRRAIELESEDEAYDGEKGFYLELKELLENNRINLGACVSCDVLEWYKSVKCDSWKL